MKKYFVIFILFALITSCKKEIFRITGKLVEINSLSDFESKIESGVSVVFFHASWCTVCAEQRPAVEANFENPNFSSVFFGEVEFEDNADINLEYGIEGFPTIVIYKDGLERKRFTGKGHSEEAIATEINALL